MKDGKKFVTLNSKSLTIIKTLFLINITWLRSGLSGLKQVSNPFNN